MRGYRPGSQHPSDAVAQFARAVGSSVSPKTGAVMLNVEGVGAVDGDAKTPGEGSSEVEFYGALGVVARPLPPDTVGGVDRHLETVCLRTGDALVPIAARDVRLNQAFPNPKPGDVLLVGYASNFVKLAADGNLFAVVTSDGTPNGQLVQLQHRKDGLAYVAPWGKLTYDAGGLHALHISGARIDLGGIGGMPAPFSSLGSYATLSAAMVKLECSACTVGPEAGVHDNAVKATPLETLHASLSASLVAMSALNVALGAFVASPAVAILANSAALTVATALTTATTQLAATIAALAAASVPGSPTSVRSQSLTVT